DGAPEVKPSIPGAVARPGVASKLDRLAPVLGSPVVGEREGDAGGPARHLADLGERRLHGLALLEAGRGVLSGQERQLAQVLHTVDFRRSDTRFLEATPIVRRVP